MTLGLAIISKTKKEAQPLIDQLKPYVDEIVVFDKYDYKDGKPFSWARNESFKLLKTDWIVWFDTDDYVENPEKLKELIEAHKSADIIYLPYYYDFDETLPFNTIPELKANCIALHWRERLTKNNGNYKWVGNVHETIDGAYANQIRTDVVSVIHNPNQTPEERIAKREASLMRNLEILEKEYEKDGDNTDPRSIYYLAVCYFSVKDYANCVKMSALHIELSGSDEDKFDSWRRIADCARAEEKLDAAIRAEFEAMKLLPDRPDSYLGLAESMINDGQYAKAIEWIQMGLTKPMPDTLKVIDPTRYTIRALDMLSFAYLKNYQIEEAYNAMKKLKQLSPEYSAVKEHYQGFEDIYYQEEFIKKVRWIYNYLEEHDKKKQKGLLDIIPANIAKDDRVFELRSSIAEPKTWDKDSVVIFCGVSYEEWTPESIKTGGIGGSEEAVINMSNELTKMGKKVTVYNECGDKAGDYNGVEYKNYYEINFKDTFDTFISWRNPLVMRHAHANRRWLWLHDVPDPRMYTKEILDNTDKILVLSNYHKSFLKFIPDDKFMVTSNGIDLSLFEGKEERDLNTLIYSSAYNRGLEHLLEWWPEIKKAVPEAKLRVFYGFNTSDSMQSNDKEYQAWKKKILEGLKQEGIYHGGRIDQVELAKEYERANIWAYPTEFPEISCITAMKAQAAGTYPITSGFAALEETQRYGIKDKIENLKDELIKTLQGKTPMDRVSMQDWAKKNCSWEHIAKQWVREM